MSLVDHKEGYRNVWMFPRCKRSVPPWSMSRFLYIFLNWNKENWSSNQEIQDKFYEKLEQFGLKREGFQRHSNPGGARTYRSMMSCLGLLFRRKINDTRYILPTLAGDAVLNGENSLEAMQYVLLKHQYPSHYGRGHNVKINPNLKVKPFMFILQLLNFEDIESLTNNEIAVAVTYGHNHECLDLVAAKIFELRNGASFKEILEDPEADTFTPRGSEDIDQRIKNIKDIANTCKNYMSSNLLVNVEKRNGLDAITFNEDIREKFEKELKNIDKFIFLDDDVSEEQFQRQYGCYGKEKDTRNLKDRLPDDFEQEAGNALNDLILSEFFKWCGKRKVKSVPQEFLDYMYSEWGVGKEEVKEVVSPYIEKALDIFEVTFLDLSRGGKADATNFEKALTNLFSDEFYFKAEHTGNKKGPPDRPGDYADVFLVALDNEHCALVDAKASPSYSLPHGDRLKMLETYIPHVDELFEDNDLTLEFCLYVAHGYTGTVDNKLISMSKQAPCAVSAIKAKPLLELSKKVENKEDQRYIRQGFNRGGLLKLEYFNV